MDNDGLQLRELRKSFPGFRLGPLSFHLRPGIAYGLLGANGAGKTTLLNLITLQLRANSGQIFYNGQSISWGETAWKTRFSYIREIPSFYDELTVAQTLHLAGLLYNTWDEKLAGTLLQRFRLESSARVGTLSKGSKVKLGIVAGLAHSASLLILDEPTAGLDPTTRAELQQLLRELVGSHGFCILVSSHIFEDLEQVGDEVLIMRRGQLAFHSTLRAFADMALCRLPDTSPLVQSSEMRFVWKKNGYNWIIVPKGSKTRSELLTNRECIEELSPRILAAVYEAIENRVE
jgi:ABC-2 type transport system ATP-binding protein